jgi:hypothetical protein
VVGRRNTTRGTASPQAVGFLPEYRLMMVFREVVPLPTDWLGMGSGSADAAGTLGEADTGLAGGVGSGCTVPAGLGAVLELVFGGLQPRTVHERVPSRKVLRLTSNPIPRLLPRDRHSRISD